MPEPGYGVSSHIESQSRAVRQGPEQRAPQSAAPGISVNAEHRQLNTCPNIEYQLWRARFEGVCFSGFVRSFVKAAPSSGR